MINIIESNNYEGLVSFFIKHELEFSEEEPIPTDTLVCWRAEEEDGTLAGACVLALREEEYIIDGIAVEPAYRKDKLGSRLLQKAIDKVKILGGKRLYLVARAPDFFRKNNFITIDRTDAPTFFECFTCPQYNVSCFPEVMVLEDL